ncbi:hypothetical protein [Dehalobacter sp. 4CP]|uniref:hypothetical protein n=1 Tax=Dehalobacter sp. CP TaxID=2594474 RepID=UPI0039E784AA
MSNMLFTNHMSLAAAANDPRYFSMTSGNYGNPRTVSYPYSHTGQTGQPRAVLPAAFLPGTVLSTAKLPGALLPSPVLRSPVLPSSILPGSYQNGYLIPAAPQVTISANNLNKILIAILLLVSLDLVFVRPGRSLPSMALRH